MIKTTWEYSLETEALRLIHDAHQIAVGFFKVNGFLVLPSEIAWKNPLAVSFPDLPYYKIPRFWEKVRVVDAYKLPVKADVNFIKSVKSLLAESKFQLPIKEIENLKNKWQKAQNKVIKQIAKIIPSADRLIKSITIYPTSFGTTCSFNIPDKFPSDFVMYLRADGDIYTITEGILSILVRKQIERDLDGVWSEAEILVDWMLTKSTLAGILKKYEPKSNFIPTIKTVRVKQSARLLAESEKFYQKLGLPFKGQALQVSDNRILINQKLAQNLTKREEEILKFFIQKQGQIVSFDELADLIIMNTEDFSLYAISKLIQRLRDKLEKNGISGSYIQTLRGQGYLLKD